MSRAPDGFLGRWSARKQAVRGEDAAPVQEPSAAPEASDEPEKTDAEILEELGLKDPDDMAPGDDFSGFMASGIPERLRNRALRKLWLTNPVLANLDELVEYGEDYTDAATVVENLQTAYRIGKGFLRQEEIDAEEGESGTPEQMAESESLAADAAPEEESAVDAEAMPSAEPESPDHPEIEAENEPGEAAPAIAESRGRDGVPVRPRRMVFRVENS